MIPHLTMSSMMSLMRSVLKLGWLKLAAILISHAQHFIQGRLKGSNIIIPDDEAWMFCFLLSVTVRCSWVSSK